MREGEGLLSQLPSLDRLREACKREREWWWRAEALLQQPENYPYLETLEALVGRGRFGYLNVNLCGHM